ncbi:hypothetical protein BDM02DRAFT_3111951 [Thelephora ganbajun]|uniref:Uncharacterized protein n=1 Tax=Thelephora ganbajun TaxID=370292 RepID=A0ACB6ZLV3_THEGA|nr:hypothetical protein BDM02DRAFT_3111951 [Thelephora ganbajun]
MCTWCSASRTGRHPTSKAEDPIYLTVHRACEPGGKDINFLQTAMKLAPSKERVTSWEQTIESRRENVGGSKAGETRRMEGWTTSNVGHTDASPQMQ